MIIIIIIIIIINEWHRNKKLTKENLAKTGDSVIVKLEMLASTWDKMNKILAMVIFSQTFR